MFNFSAIRPPGELQQVYSALWLVFPSLLELRSSPLLSERRAHMPMGVLAEISVGSI